jgi:ferritin-like protein
MDTTTRPPQASAPSRAGISTIEGLREHLQWAIELEHATIPPYMCALCSLDPERNPVAVEVVTTVFMEEMLHLTLAANLLNAVGGRPVLDAPQLMPGYPTHLPHGDRSFEVSLAPFGPEALELFLKIERPSATGAPAESDGYETIGQFYEAIEQGLRRLCAELGEDTVFSGDPGRQVTRELAYRGAGDIVAVTDLASALRALKEVVEQGEGAAHHAVWDGDHDMFHPERDEVAHYYRFEELRLGRRYRRGDTPQSGPSGASVTVDWAGVHPMRPNARVSDHAPGNPIRVAQEAFNQAYCTLLHQLEESFNGNPRTLGSAVGSMYGLKAQALALMQMPVDDGSATAGPTFEYVDPADRW